MPTSTKVNDLKINRLTKAQYDTAVEAGIIGENELSIITDLEGGQVIQVDELPEATSENEGKIYQYTGETIPEVEANATIEQTVGSGLTNLEVDIEKFEEAEQPEDGDIVDFVCTDIIPSSINCIQTEGDIVTTITCLNPDDFISTVMNYLSFSKERVLELLGAHNLAYFPNNVSGERFYWGYLGGFFPDSYLDYFSFDPTVNDYVRWAMNNYVETSAVWIKNENSVNIVDYGISYNGIPESGDTLEVEYSAFKPGITNGYFYQDQPQYSDPVATIEQTVGSQLTDLTIDVDKFVEIEQPSGDETVTFICSVEETLPKTQDYYDNVSIEIFDTDLFLTKLHERLEEIGDTSTILFFMFRSLDEGSGTRTGIDVRTNDTYHGGFEIVMFNNDTSDGNAWGVTVTGQLPDINAWHDGNSHITPYMSFIWYKNSTEVNLSDYGISYTGTPEDNDELTVTYTHPSVIGYQWNQKDVQPSSGKPSGGESIDWATIVDVHEGENRGWETFPIYTIEGGLPDGEYEFYWQTKCSTDVYYRPIGYTTYKAIININNDSQSCYGIGGYVIDGQWMGDGNFKVGNNNIWSLFKKSGNDIIIYNSGLPFATDIFGYNPSYGEVLECFKLSSIKNTKTGEKYIATGKLFDGNWPSVDYSYSNYIAIEPLQNEPFIPQYHVNNDWYNPKDNQYYRIQPYNSISTSQHAASCSELDISMSSKSGGKWHIIVENSYNSYKATLLEASGNLANVQLGYNQNGNTYIYLNNTDISDQYINVSIGAKGSSEAASGWSDTTDSFTPITINKIGNPVTKDNYGTILQYTDETTSEYKKGYFYQATGTEVIVPESIVCTQTYGGESIEITCNDYNGLVSTLHNYTGWTESYIKERLQAGDWLSCRPFETDYVWYWAQCGALPDSVGIGDYFTLNPYPQTETQFTVIDVPEHTEIQDGHWEQINVQPNPIPNQTGNANKVLTTNGTVTSWSNFITTPTVDPVLEVNDWVEDQQTGEITQVITVQGVTSSNGIFVCPAPLSVTDFTDNGVMCIAQGTNTLTFKCDSIPTNPIVLSIIILG